MNMEDPQDKFRQRLSSSLLIASQLVASSSSIRAEEYLRGYGAAWQLSGALQGSVPKQLAVELRKLANNNNINNNNNHHFGGQKSPGEENQRNAKKRKVGPDSSSSPLPESSPRNSVSPPSSIESIGKELHKDRQFTCGVCNRSFGYKHVLQNHERTHTGEKPFECQQCHKRFTRDHHLKTHMRLHTGERPYHCEHCDRQFVQVANLRRHLRVHTGEKPYVCEFCTSKFSDSNQLKAHLLIHTNEKPFECEKCRSRFRRKHHLLQHKCGTNPINDEEPSSSDVSEEVEEETAQRKIPIVPNPILPIALRQISAAFPVQTEPEDLSMRSSSGRHSNSSGISHGSTGSNASRSPSSGEDHDDVLEENRRFLQRRSSGLV